MPGKYSHGVVLAQHSNLGLINLPTDEYARYTKDVELPKHNSLRTRGSQKRKSRSVSGLTTYPDGSYIQKRGDGSGLPPRKLPSRQRIDGSQQGQTEETSAVPYVSLATQKKEAQESSSGTTPSSGNTSIPTSYVKPRNISTEYEAASSNATLVASRSMTPNVSQQDPTPLLTPPSSLRAFQAPTTTGTGNSESKIVDGNVKIPNSLEIRPSLRQEHSNRSVQTQIYSPLDGKIPAAEGLSQRQLIRAIPVTKEEDIHDSYNEESLDELSSISDSSEDDFQPSVRPFEGPTGSTLRHPPRLGSPFVEKSIPKLQSNNSTPVRRSRFSEDLTFTTRYFSISENLASPSDSPSFDFTGFAHVHALQSVPNSEDLYVARRSMQLDDDSDGSAAPYPDVPRSPRHLRNLPSENKTSLTRQGAIRIPRNGRRPVSMPVYAQMKYNLGEEHQQPIGMTSRSSRRAPPISWDTNLDASGISGWAVPSDIVRSRTGSNPEDESNGTKRKKSFIKRLLGAR